MQTSPSGTTYIDAIAKITSEKGFMGLWDGFVPWGAIQALAKGGVFGLAHAVATSVLIPMADRGLIPKQLALTLAGGIAGGFQGYVLSPTLLLKTRVMTNPIFREKMSLSRTTFLSLTIGFQVVRTEGLWALMKGSNVFATKRVFDWATRYYFSDALEAVIARYKKQHHSSKKATTTEKPRMEAAASSSSLTLSAGEKVSASLLGGAASNICTMPLDILVTTMQKQESAGENVPVFDKFFEELQTGACMRGFEARLAHVCFTTVVMKTGTTLMYDFLFKS